MIKEIITITEHHENGALFYVEKRAIIDPFFINAYIDLPTFRMLDNICYIKLENTKYFDNNQIAWSLKWNENGELINPNDLQYRKDGSIIKC
jgi:hypothetical protein